MDFNLKYSIDSNELEPSVAEKYREAITKYRESDNLFESLESLNCALEALENSSYVPDREIEWSVEMIKAYRNLGRVYRKIVSSDDFKKDFSRYMEFVDVLSEYMENHDASDLKKILGVLKDCDMIENSSELEEMLQSKEEDRSAQARINSSIKIL